MKRPTLNIVHDVIIKCWADPTYKQRFLDDPYQTLMDNGAVFDSTPNIHVCENGPRDLHIVVARKPVFYDNLPDEDKDASAATAVGKIIWLTFSTFSY
jgi:hypothetical protein